MVPSISLRIQRPLVGAALLAGLLLPSTAFAQLDAPPSGVPSWTQLGPLVGAGPSTFYLTEGVSDPERVYAGSTTGVLVSSDRGQTWARTSEFLPTYATLLALEVSPNDADLLLAGEYEVGLLRSADGGLTWTQPFGPAAGAYVTDIAIAEGCGTVYVSTSDAVWRSYDEGEHFFEMLTDLAGDVRFLGLDRTDEDHLFAFVQGDGLYETLDGGFTWTQEPSPLGSSNALSFAIDPHDSQRMLVAQAQIFLTEDGGDTWADVSPAVVHYTDCLAFDLDDPQRFYAGRRMRGLAVTDDGGATWAFNTDPGLDAEGGALRSILPSVSHPGQILLASTGGVFRSTDTGATFERRNHGLDAYAAVSAIAADPFDADHLVARTGGSAFYTHDGGATWSESTGMREFHGFDIAADAVIPGRFYAGSWGGGMWRSDDGGHSFYESAVGSPRSIKIAVHPTVGGRLFVAGSGIQRSDDGGVTFTLVSPGGWSWAAEVSTADPDVMYVSKSANIQYSHDGGVTWATSSTPTPVREIVADPDVPLRAFAAGWYGLTRTDDGGVTWVPVPGASHHTDAVAFTATGPKTLVVNEQRDARVLFSRGGGATLRDFPFTPETTISDFAPSLSGVFAGTVGSGVYVWQ